MILNSGQIKRASGLSYGDIQTPDIINSLSNQCRYAGHTIGFYSVAQHSVLTMMVSRFLYDAEIALHSQCLIHDYAEAYMQDIIGPHHKYLDGLWLDDFRKIDILIHVKYGIDKPADNSRLKYVDKITLLYEMYNLFPSTDDRNEYISSELNIIDGVKDFDRINMHFGRLIPLLPDDAYRMLGAAHKREIGE